MKRKLQLLGVATVTFLLSTQFNFAQTGGNYPGGISVTPAFNTGTLIEFEHFDLGGNANTTVNTSGVPPFSYSDSSAGNSGTAAASATPAPADSRSNTDVDVFVNNTTQTNPTGSGFDVGGFTNTEYLYYTVNFATSGSYRLDVTYKVLSAKNLTIQILNPSNLSPVSAAINTSMPLSGQPYATNPTNAVDVCAGTYVLKILFNGGAGPSYDSFTVTKAGELVNADYCTSLGANTFETNTKSLVAYPNNSHTGVFNLNIDSVWDVYSQSGTKILSGKGTMVNLSGFSKGIYILKTANDSVKLLFQ